MLQTQQLQWLLARCNINNELLVLKLTIDARKLESAVTSTHSWLEVGTCDDARPSQRVATGPAADAVPHDQPGLGGGDWYVRSTPVHTLNQTANRTGGHNSPSAGGLQPSSRPRGRRCGLLTLHGLARLENLRHCAVRQLAADAAHLCPACRRVCACGVCRDDIGDNACTTTCLQEINDPALRNELIEASSALLDDLATSQHGAQLPYVPSLKIVQANSTPTLHVPSDKETDVDFAIARVRGLSVSPDHTSAPSTASSTLSSKYSLPPGQHNVFFGTGDGLIASSELTFSRDADGNLAGKLGQGVTGVVYSAVRGQVQKVAVKVLSSRSSARQRADFMREMQILQSCRDRHIVQWYGAVVEEGSDLMLVMELMEGGTLYDAISNDATDSFLWWRRGKSVALDIARGLAFLHSRGIVHMDMKSANVCMHACVVVTRDVHTTTGAAHEGQAPQNC